MHAEVEVAAVHAMLVITSNVDSGGTGTMLT